VTRSSVVRPSIASLNENRTAPLGRRAQVAASVPLAVRSSLVAAWVHYCDDPFQNPDWVRRVVARAVPLDGPPRLPSVHDEPIHPGLR
jgi:hypothetical protein